jgi:hypothetical protein
MKAVTVTTALLMLCFNSYGQEAAQEAEETTPPATGPTADLVKPGSTRNKDANKEVDGLEVLFQLVGRWEVNESYPKTDDTPDGGTGEGKASYKKSLDNTHVVGDYRSRCKELEFDVEGHAVFTYDEGASTYLYWWFDNYGGRSMFEGQYDASRQSLVFSRDVEGDDGDTLTHLHTFHFQSDGNIKLTMQVNSGGRRSETILTSTLYKKGTRPSDDDDDALEQAPKKPKHTIRRGI